MGPKNWVIAERVASKILEKVHPTSVSEDGRKEVIDYIQKLFRDKLGIEVILHGSVPLKTYLPEGDIDFTAFCGSNLEDSLATEMKFVLQEEEKNIASKLVVNNVQLIFSELKIVRCIVQNIVVDVSFNKIGGLYSLCFLEQMDRLIGKDHLFKRSIILIKAWSYYESRTLGAYHGLISTYALEMLVLHIFQLYHSTLNGPLAVLYKFLDYFSKFDWEIFGVSLSGPVRLCSLPATVVEMPEDTNGDLLLNKDFLSSCINIFSVPSRGDAKNYGGFQLKHLNVVDPLKENNNLGRSVSKGNFYRVRRAFTYGIRKLMQILSLPKNHIASELHKFFSTTMMIHGGKQKPYFQGFDTSLSLITKSCGDRAIRTSKQKASKLSSSSSARDLNHETPEESVNLLTYLSGNFEHYFECLQYGQRFQEQEVYLDSFSCQNSNPTQFEQCRFLTPHRKSLPSKML